MLVYKDYFNADVSIYISHITIFTFATLALPIEFRKIKISLIKMHVAVLCNFFKNISNCNFYTQCL